MEPQATYDTADLDGSLIVARDIEELEASVFPWQLGMQQVSTGTMDARIRLGQVGGILVTREHWSRKVTAVGATPPGCLALAGLGSRRTFKWCGHEIDSRHLVCGLDSAEVDFATPRSADHWVVLIPQELMMNYLGEEAVAALRGRRVLRGEPNLSRRLLALANRAVDPSSGCNERKLGRYSKNALRADLLDAAAQLVTGDDWNRDHSSPPWRYETCRNAITHVRSLRVAISVPELAASVGVKRRTLERAFQENLGISPYRFLRLSRLNRLHRELRKARPDRRKVTALLLDCGFSEMGRTAAEYKDLFGTSPSTTLTDKPSLPGLRLADALVEPRSSNAAAGTGRAGSPRSHG